MDLSKNKIAVIGMACRLPGADNIDEFWSNLLAGKDTIKHFTDEELLKSDFPHRRKNPDYVAAKGVLSDIDKFDAGFFSMTPREATETDPQHRLWFEVAWEAFENAGCDAVNYKGAVGVFAGGSRGGYLYNNILRDSAALDNFLRSHSRLSFQLSTGNDISFLSTQTAYKFNLRGPAINVQSACSTSLVAIIQACQSLFSFESDICLAGGVSVSVPQESGYLYQEGGISSPDGHCRPFDSEAKGTVLSNGVGAVILKREEDAIRDNDTIYALVSGWALNNDGSNKVSYTAPSVDGQAEVIMMAQSFAEISPEDVSFIEAHGTATPLGDPIEIAALTKAFSAKTKKKQFCGIGSVKSNIGHTDSAAGVAGFIKACLAAYYKKIPASIHFKKPNPHIDFENSPFFVLNELKEWKEKKPLIIGVSSFGIGGTNSHVIIEEPPVREAHISKAEHWPELILLSAKSEYSLNKRKSDLVDFVKSKPDLDIHDIAYTLGAGRTHMPLRSFLVATGSSEISDQNRFVDGKKDDFISKIAFMFPGQGAQYISMGRDLYKSDSLFRQILDECFDIVRSIMNVDLRSIIFEDKDIETAERKLSSTDLTQPALFIIEYGIAKILEKKKIRPDYLIGHSIGEYTAACIAGVFDLQTTLKIVIKRGELMQKMPSGMMMAVQTDIDNLTGLNSPFFEIAADNSPGFCSVSFSKGNEDNVRNILDSNGIKYIPLNTSHAFHSASFDPILSEFRDFVDKLEMRPPVIPFISCLTGRFITRDQATSGTYWAQQLRNTVHFREGISLINENEDVLFLEVGPNTHLSTLARENKKISNKKAIISTLGKQGGETEQNKIIASLGKMFNIGIGIDFLALQQDGTAGKIALPSYPFMKTRHWIDVDNSNVVNIVTEKASGKTLEDIPGADNEISQNDTLKSVAAEDIGTTILNIWKSQIGIDQIGLNDNFFEIGGHSMLALQIITRLKEDLHHNISLKSFLENPTVNGLISLIKSDSKVTEVKTETSGKVDFMHLPLSDSQKRLWIFSSLETTNPAYNISLTYHISGDLNTEVFRRSLSSLFDRHFILHSVFKQDDGVPYCEIIPKPVAVEILDFSETPNSERFDKVLSFVGDDTRKMFNLETGPLFRLYLIKLDNSDYYFHATVHHLVFDGWSGGIFIHNLKQIYNSYLIGKDISLEDVKPYYIEYFRELLNTGNEGYDPELTKFWVENLSDCPPKLDFPYDFQRKNFQSGFGEYVNIEISGAFTSKLREISIKENATLFSTVLSAMGLLFSKYSGEKDICIGTHVSNRPRTHLEKIFGMFVNTVPIRLKIDENTQFGSFINYTKDVVLEAIAHQGLPFEKIIDAINPERYSNINPLFQVSVVWLYNPASAVKVEGLKWDHVNIKKGISPFDITFYLTDKGDHIEGNIEYNVDILSQETIIRLRDNLLHLLQTVVENPGQKISEVSVISANDRKRLSEFNSTETVLTNLFVQDLFEKQAVNQPAKRALKCGDTILSYKSLNEQANQLSNHLLSLGVKGGDAVGICLERSVDMVVSVLGVLKAGCCYLPMDPMFPDDRLKYMFEDSGAKVLISQSSLRSRFVQFTNAEVVLTDTDKQSISGKSKEKPELKINNQSLAYIIYTSGSTGKPKGVKVHHEAVVNFLASMLKKPGITSGDRLLGVTTLSFDISVLELFLPLSSGSELVIAEINDITDGRKLSDLLDGEDITLMQATPATWTLLLSSGWKGRRNMKALCGGEAVAPGLVRELLPKVSSLWNMYGPTETTVWSTCKELTDSEPPILIGTPIDNTTIYILDKSNRELPVGVIGEVCIGGLGVTKGYHNRPELTEEKFIRYENGKIIYRTGDLGRFLSDGNIELFGRSDNQIKLRGFRIEPGEIESVLSRLPGIKEAVVKVHRFDDNDERLVAFLNTDDNFKLTYEAIAKSLSDDLPVYMIPSFIQVSTEFPRLPNGKINKKALIFEVDDTDQKQEVDFDNLTSTQKRLISIWSQILKIPKISISDNFFSSGGNSLLGIRLINKLREEFGFILTFRDFLSNSTISQLSALIDSKAGTITEAIELVHLTATTNLPLTRNQKRLWFISQLQPDRPIYIIQSTYKFYGTLNEEIFKKSLNLLFHRHHIVFTVVKTFEGKPYCEIVPGEVAVNFSDFSRLSENEKLMKVHELIEEDSRTAFNLESGPLFRLNLIRTSPGEHYFHMSIHHIIFDGWSFGVFINDLNNIYNSLLIGKEVLLEKLEFQQYDFAQWESGVEDRKESVDFWRENLSDCSSVLNFPYDFQRSDKKEPRGGVEVISLSKSLTSELRRVSTEEGASLFTTMICAYGILLHTYSGEDDLNIGLPIAYRPHTKLENIFGMFVNTVVVRLKFEKGDTFRDLIKYTENEVLNAISHQDIAFDTVVDIVKPERIFGANPIFQAAFEWQNNLGAPLRLEGIRSEKVSGLERPANFDINMYLWENGDIIEGEIEYNRNLLKEDSVNRFRENLINLLQTVVENPGQKISEVSVISANDRKRLSEFNSTETVLTSLFVQDLFEKQAVNQPAKRALKCGDTILSYKSLNEQANQLSNHLLSLGVKGGDAVGICLERSVDMVVSVLGVLKAGCCYLPMDPMFPDDRLKYMFEDSGAKVLISQSSLRSRFVQFNNAEVVLTDTDKQSISGKSKEKPELKINNQSLAYIIYTSGSTGKPKGVKVHHEAVVNFLASMLKKPGITSGDRLLGVTTLSFDISVLELFLPLSSGSELVIAEINDITDGRKLSDLLDGEDITLMQATPATWTLLLSSGWKGRRNMKALCGGEAVAPGLVRELLPKVSSLWNMYGPTETTVWSTCKELTDSEPPILIGTPIDNTTIYILDKSNRELPVGVIGEVCIGGLGVTKGYHNRPELTEEKFIRYENGKIIYRTGDLGRFLSDGNIELFGRSDNQIKLRGFRIEPGEIESVLSRLPGIKEAVVKVHRFDDNDDRLVAFMVVDKKNQITKETIIESLSHNLPQYMIPSFFQEYDDFPRLPNGKVNKKGLVFNEKGLIANVSKASEILSPTEEIIYKIWVEALKIKDISVNDNFFQVGGNSLMAISLFSRIESTFKVSLGLRVFFDSPRISSLAEIIDLTLFKLDVGKPSSQKETAKSKIVRGEI